MSSPLSIKRQKLDNATAKLKKPFVSPMRSAKPDQTTTSTPLRGNFSGANITPAPYVPSILAHTVKPAYPAAPQSLHGPASNRGVSTPLRKQPSFAWSTSKKTSHEEQAAQKTVTALEIQIRNVQKDLDILKQAEQLNATSTDVELEALSQKWRLCSQAVAEELFGTVKERVQRMGGVAAWREMEKRKYERAHGLGEFAQEEQQDDADCEFDSQGEELSEGEQEHRKKMKRQAKQEAMDAAEEPDKSEAGNGGDEKRTWQEESNADDDSFTMDMMLRSLNIDLDVIGYDKNAQRWN